MSFVFGDDFNFVLATNNLITLYDVKINKQKAKTVKQIALANMTEPVNIFLEPLSNTIAAVDAKGQVQIYFLNLYKTKAFKAKPFQLDITQPAPASQGGQPANSQSQGTASASNLPKPTNPNPYAATKTSFTERMGQYFRQSTSSLSLAPQISNQNLKLINAMVQEDEEPTQAAAE